MSSPIVIPPDHLAPETVRNLVQEFVTRNGTDYGEHEYSLQAKTDQLLTQVYAGQVLIVFDGENQSCNLLTVDEGRRVLPAEGEKEGA